MRISIRHGYSVAIATLIVCSVLPTKAANAQGYPTPEEARVAYDWLHPQLTPYFWNSGSGWAIDELDAVPGDLPAGVLAVPNLSPGWATFGLVLPEGSATEGVKVGSLTTQTDVKTRWADGSIRFAVVTAKIPSGGDYEITADSHATGGLTPTVPANAKVTLTISGTAWVAQLGSQPTNDLWLSGPLVKEWRQVVAPKNPSGSAHPFLRVYFDYRAYFDDEGRWDVTVENLLDHAAATQVDYGVTIRVGGQTLFQKSGVAHGYLTRWRRVFGVNLDESSIVPDFESIHRAKALPRYLSDAIQNRTYDLSTVHYEILGRGANSYNNMGNVGGRRELAPYPAGTAQYLVHRTQNQRQWVLANGNQAGSWPVHIREANGDFVSIDDRPDFWLDSRGDDKPAGDMNATGHLNPDNAHVPSWAYAPYLLTGDRYYADELGFWGNFVILRTWPPERGFEGEGGRDAGIVGRADEVRGFGWGMRNMADAAAYLPDDHPLHDYLGEKVLNNLVWADNYAANFDAPPTGAIYVKGSNNYPPYQSFSVWQHSYLGWALDHTNQQGFLGGGLLLEGLAGFQSKLGTSDPDYPREYITPYYLKIGLANGGCCTYFQTMAEIFDVNYDGGSEPPVDPVEDYGGAARLMLGIVAQDLPGGQRLLGINKSGTGGGTVTSSPGGIDCGNDCQQSFADGTVVEVFADPDPDSVFAGWSGNADCSDGQVTMDRNRTCTATFNLSAPDTFSLSVAKSGTGGGAVTSSPGGIDCGNDCQQSFADGTVVEVFADPDPDSVFAGWSGNADCSDGQVTMDRNRTCTATFNLSAPDTFSLSVAKSGTGGGAVTSSPGGIDCGNDCQQSFADGTVVEVFADPDPDSVFAGWSGNADCSDGQVTMDRNRTCTATFNTVPNGSCTEAGVVQLDNWSSYPNTTYALSTSSIGGDIYTDRGYTITSITDNLRDQTIVMTAQADKMVSVSQHLTFTVCVDADVYVAYDQRAQSLPTWLDDPQWALTGETLASSDGGASPMLVFQSHFPADTQLTLGGNREGGSNGAMSNYLVIVKGGVQDLLSDGFESGDTSGWFCDSTMGQEICPINLNRLNND